MGTGTEGLGGGEDLLQKEKQADELRGMQLAPIATEPSHGYPLWQLRESRLPVIMGNP